jgi:hypothetical protein
MADNGISVYDLVPAKADKPATKGKGISVASLTKPVVPEKSFTSAFSAEAATIKVKGIEPAINRGLSWVSSQLDQTDYGRSVKEAFSSASAMQAEGAANVAHAQGPMAPVEGFAGVAKMTLGALATLFAPITALVDQGAVKPTQEMTRKAAEKLTEGMTAKEKESFMAQEGSVEKIEDFAIQTAVQVKMGSGPGAKTVPKPLSELSPAEKAEFQARQTNLRKEFDTFAATDPHAALAIAKHVEQVDKNTAKYLKNRVQKFIDASDEELSIIGKDAAAENIKSLEANFDDIKAEALKDKGTGTGEGKASPGKGRRSGPADPLVPADDRTGLGTGEGKASPGRGGRSGPSDPLIPEKPKPGPRTPTPREENASGESKASQEAINRVSQEKANGQPRFILHADDTVTPLIGVDAVDARALKGDVIVQKGIGKTPYTILDRGGLAQGLAQGRLSRAIGLGQIEVTARLNPEQVSATIRTAAKDGLEALTKPENERQDMSKTKEQRAAEREKVADRRSREEGGAGVHDPEKIPKGAAEREGEAARRDANDPNEIIYFGMGVPITRAQVEAAFTWVDDQIEKIPGAKIAQTKMAALYHGYIETFNPEARGPAARTAGAAIARNFFKQAEAEHKTWELGKKRREYFLKMGPTASMEFVHGMESGKPFTNPIWERARQVYSNWTNALVAQDTRTYAGSGKDLPYAPREHYVPHLFKDAEGVIRWAEKKYGNRWADPKFIKDRSFNLYQEAMDAGFTPKFTNPEEIMQARQFASDIAALRTDMLADFERKGVAVKAAKGSERPPPGFSPNSRRSPTGIRYWVREDADPLMHNAFDSASLWNLQGSALKRGVSAGFRGWMGVKNALIPIKLGLSLFHPMHVLHIDASATLARESKSLLGAPSLANVRDFMLNASTAYLQPLYTNPKIGYPILRVFQGKKPFESLSDADKVAYRDLAEGGMVPTRPREETSGSIQKLKDSWAKKSVGTVFHLPLAIMSATTHPLFGVWIPTLKIASYLKDVKVARELNPGWTDGQRQEAFRNIARKVEARYGEMNYNSLFMDKMLKDIGVATNLSLGWNIGLLDQYAGGAIDLGRAAVEKGSMKEKLASGILDRPVFAAYYVGSALAIGGVMHYMLSGKPPEQLIDYTHPQSGEKDQYGKPVRLNTMFYTREFEGLYKHMEQEGAVSGLTDFVKNKGSGLMEMSRTALTGINSLGDDIRNPEDPAYKQFEQTLANTLTGLNTISIEAINKSTGPTGKKVGLSVLGFTPAGKYISETVLEGQISDRFNRYVRPQEKPFQAVEMSKDTKQLRELYAKDDPKYDDKLETVAKKYDMTSKDVHKMEKVFASPKEQEFDPSVYMFSKLPWEEQKPLLDKMSEAERDTYLLHISKAKRQKYQRETEDATP